METLEENKGNKENELFDEQMFSRWEATRRRGKFIGGLLVVAAGSLYLAKEMGVVLPEWVFSWQMLLIALGIVTGVKHLFRNFMWVVFTTIGTLFLLRDYYGYMDFTNYIVPVLIIIAGLFIMFGRRARNCNQMHFRHRRKHWKKYHQYRHQQWGQEPLIHHTNNGDDYIEVDSVFGGIKKNIVSKSFRGGEVNCVFGGGELNLSQADIDKKAELEINCVFGGMRLIIPSHWELKSNVSAVLGSVEDKREVQPKATGDDGKVLVLKGSVVFGGVEILNY